MKLSWDKVKYTAQVKVSKEERAKDPTLGEIKTLEILKEVSGFAPPG